MPKEAHMTEEISTGQSQNRRAIRPTRWLTAALLITLSITSAACTDTSPDVVTEACERLSECNVLEGQSVGECTESVERNLIVFTPTERDDWERVMDGCLGFAGCETFVDCVVDNDL